MELVPDVGPPPRRAQPGEPELGPVPVGQRLESVELGDVLPGDHHRQLESDEAGRRHPLHGPDGGGERAGPPDRVVHLGGGAIQGDLHVDVVAGGQALGHLRGDPRAVGRELDPDVVVGGVVDQLPEVAPDGGLAAPDVDVEDLHPLELVDQPLALGGGQLVGIPPTGARQAVHAGQVAGVGELPGQANRRVEPELELVDQPEGGRALGGGQCHDPTRSQIIPDSARVARARS